MGASFSTLARWEETQVEEVVNAAVINSGPSLIQGAQGLTIHGGVFNMVTHYGEALADKERMCEILDFLSTVNFRGIQLDSLAKWTPGTVKWLLESSMFQFWLESQRTILWGTGMPGAGKTVLASIALDYVEKLAIASRDVCLAFVYCRYNEPMTVRNILAALVRQLLEQHPKLLSVVEALHNTHSTQKTCPSNHELLDTIRTICGHFRVTYFFIDGLDEALYDEQFELLDALKSINANFFITSRPLLRLEDILPEAIHFDIVARNEDIQLLVDRHIDRSPDLRQILVTTEARKRVVDKICESSCGMFLHASLMLQAICRCTNLRSVMDRLEKLPPRLEVLYEEAFQRIEMQGDERCTLAKSILSWVVFSFQPLTAEDVQYAVSTDPSLDWANEANLVPKSVLVSVCCGLVIVEFDGGSSCGILRLVHFTAIGVLRRLLRQAQVSPHCYLMERCLNRLIFCGIPSNGQGDIPAFGLYPESTAKRPLLRYAYESWHLHAKKVFQDTPEETSQAASTILNFLQSCTSFPALVEMSNGWVMDDTKFDIFTSPLHLISFYHIAPLLPHVYPNVNLPTANGRSALLLAAYRNDREMSECLLKMDGIDVNLSDGGGYTALMIAAEKGYADIVGALLQDPRVDLLKRHSSGRSALHLALSAGPSDGHLQAALDLIRAPGVGVNEPDAEGQVPLSLSYRHHPDLLEALVQHPHINLYCRDVFGLTPLMHACRWSSSFMLNSYLQLPNADAKDKAGASALTHRTQHLSKLATVEDYLSDYRALVSAGLNVNDKDNKGLAALAYAVHAGSRSAIEALYLIDGVDTGVRDNKGRTLLMIACAARRDPSIISLLCNSPSVDLNAEDHSRRNALMHATIPCLSLGNLKEAQAVVSVLLQQPGLQVDVADECGMTALKYAVIRSILVTAEALVSLAKKSTSISVAEQSIWYERRHIVITICDSSGGYSVLELFEVADFSIRLKIQEHTTTSHGPVSVHLIARRLKVHDNDTCSDKEFTSPSTLSTIHYEDVGSALKAMEKRGLGFPWNHAWIGKGYDGVVQQLLGHPRNGDADFNYLRHIWNRPRCK